MSNETTTNTITVGSILDEIKCRKAGDSATCRTYQLLSRAIWDYQSANESILRETASVKRAVEGVTDAVTHHLHNPADFLGASVAHLQDYLAERKANIDKIVTLCYALDINAEKLFAEIAAQS